MSQTWIVAYDIADPRRLKRVAKIMQGYGVRVQWSVFECNFSGERLDEARNRIGEVLETDEDSVRWYPLCAWCRERVTWQGIGSEPNDPEYYIV